MKIKIISSKDHWRNGWLTTPDELQQAISILQKAGIEVSATEVESIPQLEQVLDQTADNTMIWGNAYYVNNGEGKIAWLNDYVQKRNLPLLGSGAQTLRNLLQKDVCQAILKEAELPIPKYMVITAEQASASKQLIGDSGIGFPMVLKPTAESGSVGITMANNLEEATRKAKQILADFPHSHVIAETFLPSDDITCGFLRLGDKVMLLPTSYIVKSVAGKRHILSRKERLQDWSEDDKIQPYITDKNIINQLQQHIPTIIEALNVQDISRIDGRLDTEGVLRFFDVNGLPALSFPDSVMIKQCFTCFPDYSPAEVFEALVYTIVYNALLRYNMEIPPLCKEHNLFVMHSNIVIKTKAESIALG